MARARRGQSAPQADQDQQAKQLEGVEAEETVDASGDQLTVLLVAAIRAESPGPRRGALEALHTALHELKHRAASVDSHLRADYDHLLERIRAL